MELGVSISPIAFIVMMQDSVKVLPVEHNSAIDKLIDYVPDLMQRINSIINKKFDIKIQEKKDKIQQEQKEDKSQNEEKVEKVEINYDVNVTPGEYLEDE